MAELKIEKIQEKEKVEVLSQCGSGTSIYSANYCSTQAHPYGQIDPCHSDCNPTKKCKKCGKWAAFAATSAYY